MKLKTVMIAAVTGVVGMTVAALAQVFTALPAASTLTGAEIFAAVQSSVTKQVSLSAITTYVQSQIGGGASGPAGGDLSGTYPNPTVAKVDGVAYPAAPSTNTIPVVTGANTVTYQTAPVAAGGTGLTSGTSGGVLAFTAAGTLASSAALTANLPVIGGGPGAAPSVGSRSGNTTVFGTTSGSLTSGNCAKFDASGNIVDNGSTCAGSTVVFNAMAGFLPSSIAGNSTTASLTVSAGQAADSTNAAMLSIASGSSWAVANGNAANGYQGGTTLPNSSTIHFFVCFGGSGTTIFANNGTTPTAPSGYTTYFRRIFSLKTNSSGALIPGTAIEGSGGDLVFWLTTQTLDANNTTIVTASRTLITLNVPGGIKVQPFVRALGGGTNNELLLMSGDETDIAPTISTMAVPLYDMGISQLGATGSTASPPFLTTNTSAQIAARASQGTGSTIGIVTRGWSDFRRS